MRALVLLATLVLAAGCLSAAPAPQDAAPERAPEGGRGGPGPVGVGRAAPPGGGGGGVAVALAAGDARVVLTGFQGAEPNVGVTSSGALFVTAHDRVIRSLDGGFTWQAVHEHLPGADAVDPSLTSWDPMLWVDAATDRVFANHLGPYFTCSWLYWSDDGGDAWTARPEACAAPTIDHQKLAAGPPGPDAPPVAGVAYPSVLYLCSNKLVGTACSLSYDGGWTWPAESSPFPPVGASWVGTQCGYPTGHPAVSASGVVAVAKSGGCDALYVAVSLDSGLTWSIRRGPAVPGETFDPELAFSPDGTLYALWQGASDHLPRLARSSDLGQTWEGPWAVAPPDVTSTAFVALAAGADGRVALAFLGSRDTSAYPNDAADHARWHLYVVTSEDADAAAPSFLARQMTPEGDPVQVGCIDVDGSALPCRNLLDFIDAAVAPDGTVYVAYTEGCLPGCDEASESRASQVAVAWVEGWSILG